MMSESFRQTLLYLMAGIGVTSLLAFIFAQAYVKTKAPELWEQFFPGRSIGFAHDLKFRKFADWYLGDQSSLPNVDLPLFHGLWIYYRVMNTLGLILFAVYLIDFFMLVYQIGMIGGWKFR